MIEETCLVIGELEERNATELKVRYARRNKIRHIDELLNEFEMLNLADEPEIPLELRGQVVDFLDQEKHSIVNGSLELVGISDFMEALYDIQDTLMLPFEDD